MGAVFLWAWLGSSRVLHPVRLVLSTTPSDYGFQWEPCRFLTADGVPISAWVFRNPKPTGALLMLHGFGSSKAELLDVAGALHGTGRFNLVLLDFRRHGQSGGRTASFGLRETGEVKAALDFMASDPGFRGLPVGCWGISMGGAIAVLAAVRFKEILGVVADCTYARLGKAVARAQWLTYHIPQIPLGQMVLWALEWRLGCRLAQLDPIDAAGRIAPRSLFVVHGGKDQTVPPEEGRALFQAAREPKEWWLISESEHGTCYFDRMEEYVRRVTGFFQHAFLRAS